ncbi:MAG: BTAD domain-containing putative transcriptional regulator [Anaerolineales bacterium]|nr:BTAD domain-containing putative transcriptional regulator [Anaerolineales bacterium]
MLLQKKVTEAHQFISNASGLIQSSDSLYEKGLLNFVLGRLSLMEGNPPQAINQLEEAEHCFSEDGRKMESAANRIWLTAAHYQTKNYTVARQMTTNIFGGRAQVAHGILIAVHQARSWLNGLEGDVEVGRVVGDLLTRAGRLAEKMPVTRRHLHRTAHVIQIPNAHLIIQALGQASVSVGGKLLNISDWQTQSVRDLFFYFLTSQKPLTKEQVAETLWLDVDEPQRLKLRFKNEIYRLRRAVGQEVITYEDVFYSFNRALDFEYDVEAFESFLSRAKSTTNPTEQIEFYQKAVDLVHGPFLEDIYSDWAMFERERLGQTYLAALLALTGLFQQQAQPEQALVTCQRALDYDPAFESAYSQSMQIYHRLGDRASVIRIYQTCQETMQRQLGLPPSKETEELYRRLIA